MGHSICDVVSYVTGIIRSSKCPRIVLTFLGDNDYGGLLSFFYNVSYKANLVVCSKAGIFKRCKEHRCLLLCTGQLYILKK